MWKVNSEIGVAAIAISRQVLILQSGTIWRNSDCGRMMGTDVEPSVSCLQTLKFELRVIHSFVWRRWQSSENNNKSSLWTADAVPNHDEFYNRSFERRNKNMVSASTETYSDTRSDGEPGTSTAPVFCLTTVCSEESDLTLRGDSWWVMWKFHHE